MDPLAISSLNKDEMTLTEMLFVLSAQFYIEAATIGQKALENKNLNFIVMKNENDPTVKAEEAAAEKDMEEFATEESSLAPRPRDSKPPKGSTAP